MFRLSLLIVLIFATKVSYGKLMEANQPVKLSKEQELLYFPNAKNIKNYTLGFDNILSNYLWFQTVSYFGKHYSTDKEYYWLAHMCDVITELDPRHRIVYEFCTALVAWENDDADAARRMLNKAIEVEPDYWRYYYLRAMNYLIFEKDELAARDDFVRAAQQQGAPSFVQRLATKKLANLDSPDTAISFLSDMIRSAKDESQKKSLTEQLVKVINERNIKAIQDAMAKYAEVNQEPALLIDNLVDFGLTKSYMYDPYGKKYKIEADGEVTSASEIKRTKLFKNKTPDD